MITVHYIGDSTVARNNIHTYPQTGMSQGLGLYLKESVAIVSYAKNGRSTKSFLDEGRFEAVKAAVAPGDYLLVQFGHNDEKEDAARHTDPQGDFKENLRFFCDFARQAGAYPILVTPIARRLFDENGNFRSGSHGEYPDAIRELAGAEHIPLIDLTDATEKWLLQIGDEASKPFYVWPRDNTHLVYAGAVQMAGFLAAGLQKLGGHYAALLAGTDEGAGI